MDRVFKDREEAGDRLAEQLRERVRGPDALVLALPRGGVPVGFRVATALDAELDVLLVRKLGVPGHEELAMGAIALGGTRVLNEDLVASLGIPPETLEHVAARERQQIDRRAQLYRGTQEPPRLRNREVILVDDGLATGATMRVALRAARMLEPARAVVAVPLAPKETVAILAQEADEVLCLSTPEPFVAVGAWYRDFREVGDEEVRALLEQARRARAGQV